MQDLSKEDIQIIARHSNWSDKHVEQALRQNVYNDKAAWRKFLQLFFVSLGVGFTAAGIVFFFAYNWADLHKFLKIGMIESLIVGLTVFIIFSKSSTLIKNVLLVGTSMLVGVLFAVFGQIYQTGANAYDFFLGWTAFISLWVFVSNFAALWLLFIVLINTTVILYSQQVAYDWSGIFIFTLLFIVNVMYLMSALFGKHLNKEISPPRWFTNALTLISVSFGTIGMITGIFDDYDPWFVLLLVLVIGLYVLGIKFGLLIKSAFYLSIISFSIIIIVSSFLIEVSDGAGMLFFVSLFVIGSVTFVISNLIKLQKEWTN